MAGSLLELHSHNNLNILNEISEVSSILYYKGKKIAGVADLSKEADNAIVTKADGIYVDGKLLCTSSEKAILARLSIDPVQGLMLDGKQVGHSHSNKSILDDLSSDDEKGLLYQGKQVGHSHDNKSILDKFSIDTGGSLLYNGSKLGMELKISASANNALKNNADGLYVADKTQDIKDINEALKTANQAITENDNTIQTVAGNVTGVRKDVDDILQSIRNGDTFLGVDIDWLSLRTTGTQHQVVNDYLVPDEHFGNMVFANNIVTLNANRTYMVTASLRVDGGSQLCYTVQDVDTLECFGSGFANASQYMTNYGEQCLMCVIPTGTVNRRVSFHVFDQTDTPTYQGLNIIIAEIGRAMELPHEITDNDINKAIQDTLIILDAVDRSIEELNQEG